MSRVITILGSTGSIGKSALDVIGLHSNHFEIRALTANTNVETLSQQCLQWQPRYAVMCDENAAQRLDDILRKAGSDTQVLSGIQGLCQVSALDEVDSVIAGIVGAAGLLPTLAAAEAGKRILLANKEALVMSGQLFMDVVAKNGAELLPVDSEHNAIFQCLPTTGAGLANKAGISKILLTASGGPFRTFSKQQLASVTPEQAVNHPNWDMGPKISVDSATLMNKGLEVIEAHWLFGVSLDDIEVVVHSQSVIHSMVSYVDGSVLAQLGNPDMRTPIAHALAFPERIASGVEPLDIFKVAKLEFEKPDFQRFPCLRLCYEAIRMGGAASIILNAANEVAVAAFLDKRIAYTDIAVLIEQTLENTTIDQDVASIENILAVDSHARKTVNEYIAGKK
ncbi:MAG: 1-deoxy-D-xylulose-5-phosphate reductoisomerase [Gammaproteobacteria bacterium]|nr:1-deoxy-D-xylulose-5-phosphate reductoisomerase [Gammaproteobacteria bacterium]